MHICIGLFALVTTVLAGGAIGRAFGLPIGEGVYLSLLIIALLSGWVGRRAHRQEQRQ